MLKKVCFWTILLVVLYIPSYATITAHVSPHLFSDVNTCNGSPATGEVAFDGTFACAPENELYVSYSITNFPLTCQLYGDTSDYGAVSVYAGLFDLPPDAYFLDIYVEEIDSNGSIIDTWSDHYPLDVLDQCSPSVILNAFVAQDSLYCPGDSAASTGGKIQYDIAQLGPNYDGILVELYVNGILVDAQNDQLTGTFEHLGEGDYSVEASVFFSMVGCNNYMAQGLYLISDSLTIEADTCEQESACGVVFERNIVSLPEDVYRVVYVNNGDAYSIPMVHPVTASPLTKVIHSNPIDETTGNPIYDYQIGPNDGIIDYGFDITACSFSLYLNDYSGVLLITNYQDGNADTVTVMAGRYTTLDIFKKEQKGKSVTRTIPFVPDLILIPRWYGDNGAMAIAHEVLLLGSNKPHLFYGVHPVNNVPVHSVLNIGEIINLITARSNALGRPINVVMDGHGCPGEVYMWEKGIPTLSHAHFGDANSETELFANGINGLVERMFFWSCTLAQGEKGDKFLEYFSNLSGAVVTGTEGLQRMDINPYDFANKWVATSDRDGATKTVYPNSHDFVLKEVDRHPDELDALCNDLDEVEVLFESDPPFNLSQVDAPGSWNATIEANTKVRVVYKENDIFKISAQGVPVGGNTPGTGVGYTTIDEVNSGEHIRFLSFNHRSPYQLHGIAAGTVDAELLDPATNQPLDPPLVTNRNFESPYSGNNMNYFRVWFTDRDMVEGNEYSVNVEDLDCNETNHYLFKHEEDNDKITLTTIPTGPVAPGTPITIQLAGMGNVKWEQGSRSNRPPTIEVYDAETNKLLHSQAMEVNGDQLASIHNFIVNQKILIKAHTKVFVRPDLDTEISVDVTGANVNANNKNIQPKLGLHSESTIVHLTSATADFPVISDPNHVVYYDILDPAYKVAAESILFSDSCELIIRTCLEGEGNRMFQIDNGTITMDVAEMEIEDNDISMGMVLPTSANLEDELPVLVHFKVRGVPSSFNYVYQVGLEGPSTKLTNITIDNPNTDVYTALFDHKNLLPGSYQPFVYLADTLEDTTLRIHSNEVFTIHPDMDSSYIYVSDSSSVQEKLWIDGRRNFVVEKDNLFIGEIVNPLSEHLGEMDFTLWQSPAGTTHQIPGGGYAMGRRFSIEVSDQPVYDLVTVKFWITPIEVMDLMSADPNITDEQDLAVLKYNGPNVDGSFANNSTDPADYTVLIPESIEAKYGGYVLTVRVSGFSEFWITGSSSSSALPVELVEFEASVYKQTQSKLEWQTSLEINSSHYTIERSTESGKFEEIGRVEAKGNSTNRSKYTYIDVQPRDGINYYRLKMVDLDGTFAFSNIQSVRFDQSLSSSAFVIAPTITEGLLSIDYSGLEQNFEVEVLNAAGKSLFSAQRGGMRSTLDIGDLPAGIYYVRCSDVNTRQVQRIVKR